MKPEPSARCIPEPVKPNVKGTCMYCSKRFTKTRFWQKFCSQDCHHRYHRQPK